MRHPQARILVFARAPVPGRCKTRLIPALGRRGAARVQYWLTDKTLETAVASGLAPVDLYCAPDCRHPRLRRLRADYGVRLRRQTAGDLGRRMAAALRGTLRSARYAILIGTDCPALTAAHLREALDRLKAGSDFVFIPAEDGGYVLVGSRVNAPAAFRSIPWGGAGVMSATRRQLMRSDQRWSELPPLWDVDRPRDWRRLLAAGLNGKR